MNIEMKWLFKNQNRVMTFMGKLFTILSTNVKFFEIFIESILKIIKVDMIRLSKYYTNVKNSKM